MAVLPDLHYHFTFGYFSSASWVCLVGVFMLKVITVIYTLGEDGT